MQCLRIWRTHLIPERASSGSTSASECTRSLPSSGISGVQGLGLRQTLAANLRVFRKVGSRGCVKSWPIDILRQTEDVTQGAAAALRVVTGQSERYSQQEEEAEYVKDSLQTLTASGRC